MASINEVTPLPSGVMTPIVISGIVNILLGVLYALTGIGLVITALLIFTCVREFKLYAANGSLPRHEAVRRARSVATLEIIVGLFNIVSLICGIIALINTGKAERQPSYW